MYTIFRLSNISLIFIVIVTVLAACTMLQAPTATLPAATPTLQDVASRIDAYLSDLAKEQSFSGSVLVAQDGKVLISKGYGLANIENGVPNTPQTRFRIGSMTKQFTAMAILMLQAQDKLNVQDRICDHISDCPTAWQEITIHHLLTHTSGIPDSWRVFANRSKTDTPLAPSQIVALFKNEPLEFKPGQKASYRNEGYMVLGYLIEEVSGQSYEAFLQQHIFEPLKMMNTGYDHGNSHLAIGYETYGIEADFTNMSIPYSSGGLYSTVEDLYLWDQALYTEQLVSKELLDTMFTPFVPIPSLGEMGYGYGWVIGEHLNRRVTAHEGKIDGFHALIGRYPKDKVTIIVLGNQQDSDLFTIVTSTAELVLREE